MSIYSCNFGIAFVAGSRENTPETVMHTYEPTKKKQYRTLYATVAMRYLGAKIFDTNEPINFYISKMSLVARS